MNITFLVGNGFDVGLGIKTQYKHFYEYFIEKGTEENIIRHQLLDAKKKGTYNTWADLEKALGEYTKEVSMEESEKFIQDKIEMDLLLLDYLKEEQSKIHFDNDAIKEIALKALSRIRNGNNEVEDRKIKGLLEKYAGGAYLYYGISFNYTNCFDCFFEALKNPNAVIGTHSAGNTSYQEIVCDIEHIHGTLDNGEMLLGVNDESQIHNSKLANIPRIKRMLIKPQLNTTLGQNKIEKAKNIIASSRIICIYGMSLGDTDKMWWEILGKWLIENSDALLMIFKYDDKYTGRHPLERIECWEKAKEHFMDQAGISKEKRENVSEQIIVRTNNNIWEYRNDSSEREGVS